MGFWSIWHFAAFIAVALVAAWAANRSRGSLTTSGYGGWLIVFSLFLLFWAGQELAEFYRVKALIETLMPSALKSPVYHEYIGYARLMAWMEALVLVASISLLLVSRSAWAIKTIIAVLWIAGPVAAATEFALARAYFGEYLVEDDYSALAATTLFATVWTWYLLTARRVRNTYSGATAI